MKIAFCIENFKPSRGGAERYVHDLTRLLVEEGHELHIFTLQGKIDHSAPAVMHLVWVPRCPKFLKTLYFAWKVRRLLKRDRFDIIHSFGRTWGMDIFQPLGGSQLSSLVGNLGSIENPLSRTLKKLTYLCRLRRLSYFLVEKVQVKEARIVIAISAMVKNDLIRYTHLNPVKIVIVRNGVDLTKFHPEKSKVHRERFRRELGLAEEDIFILFVAHNFRLKGLHVLILALAELKKRSPEISFKVGVLGEGKKKQFSRIARDNQVADRIIFLGGREEPECYYACADICVHPSFYDPSALVVLEAMASGLPVITTAYCGTSEIIEAGKDGYIVANPGDISSLADAIYRLRDPEPRKQMGARARLKSEQFPFRRNMREIVEIYNGYINSGSRS